jgi:hypothetical protein
VVRNRLRRDLLATPINVARFLGVVAVAGMIVARNSIQTAVKSIRELLESLGPLVAFRKLYGILNALEMQIEDGRFQKHAVARLCEALLATAELYPINEDAACQLEQLVCTVIELTHRVPSA